MPLPECLRRAETSSHSLLDTRKLSNRTFSFSIKSSTTFLPDSLSSGKSFPFEIWRSLNGIKVLFSEKIRGLVTITFFLTHSYNVAIL